ncbi:MAG: formylmethanofuran dehydrogenase subunit C [Planctomycetota bacterium]
MIKLTLKARPSTLFDLSNLLPETLQGKSSDEIAAIEIYSGRRTLQTGDVFDVELREDNPNLPEVQFSGDLSRASGVGSNMTSGRIFVDSAVGNRVGAGMSGGEIQINGSTGNDTGVAMAGGTIRISGSCGDRTGAAWPGQKSGMNGGVIFVDQDCGNLTGSRMRRGVIAIGGNAGTFTGRDMRAGTILVAGSCDASAGDGMIRGTIVCRKASAPGTTFRKGQTYLPPVIPLLGSWLNSRDFHGCDGLLSETRFETWFGDWTHGLKGEFFAVSSV